MKNIEISGNGATKCSICHNTKRYWHFENINGKQMPMCSECFTELCNDIDDGMPEKVAKLKLILSKGMFKEE